MSSREPPFPTSDPTGFPKESLAPVTVEPAQNKVRDGGPAFPLTGATCGMNGMSLRDWFATHAPEVPEWFEHVPPAKDFPPAPSWQDLPKEHQREAADWLTDPCFDLSDELKWFGDATDAHRADMDRWHQQDSAARFIQWRWFYADSMLTARKGASHD